MLLKLLTFDCRQQLQQFVKLLRQFSKSLYLLRSHCCITGETTEILIRFVIFLF